MTTHKPNLNLWTIVLAAGDGTRLRPLTRALHGEDLPKQFAVIRGRDSLLQVTVARALRWSLPEHVVVIVAQDREGLARHQLRAFAGVQVVVQPRNAGTGPGVLLPLRVVLAQDRRARVVVLPSDHFVRDEEPFERCIARADTAARHSSSVVLLGAVPEKADDQYGWIMPTFDGTGRMLVSAFREKPHADVARELERAGALWSTFVMVAGARALWELAAEGLPAQAALFDRWARALNTPRQRSALTELYAKMTPADFSRNVLERARNLEVVSLPPCGWSDWGTPERVLESLRGTTDYDRLARALTASAA